MARDYYVNGESMVQVKGAAGSAIANLSQLGLTDDAIKVTPAFKFQEVSLDAWGNQKVPNEIQFMLASLTIRMNLVHFDKDILNACLQESVGGASAFGTMKRAGTRLGNSAARFAATNHFIGVNITSPVAALPWRFLHCYMPDVPFEFPLGTERSIVPVTFVCIPYLADPWNSGQGAEGVVLWDHGSDS